MTLYRCNAADRCGFGDCPHAKPHEPFVWPDGEDCTAPDERYRFQQLAGIGKVRSRCWCEPVEEADDD